MDSVPAESVSVTVGSRGTAAIVASIKAPVCTMIWSVMELECVSVESANVPTLSTLEVIVRSAKVVIRRNVVHTKDVHCATEPLPGC